MNSPSRSALRGKCTQRNFWIGDSRVDSRFGLTSPSEPGNARRFFREKNLLPPGSLYSMAKPTKSSGGLPLLPVHREEGHAVAAMKFQREECFSILPLTWNSPAIAILPIT